VVSDVGDAVTSINKTASASPVEALAEV